MMLRWFLTGSMLLALAAAPPRAAAGPLGMTGTDVTSPDGVAYTLYTGKVASFDGVPLDVDLTVPQGPISPRPLLVMMHGWGGSKTDWESPTVHNTSPDQDGYNNVAFVARGYAVLNYTARGFHGSCGPEAGSDPACAKGWTHLADRRFEIRDTKYLVGLLADAGVAVPGRIGVTGGSYGGGQSWLLALEGDRVSVADAADPEQVTLQSWTSPGGVPLHLAAAVPKYPWSDLIHSLQPNGRASDGVILPDGDRLQPFGIMKESWVSGLFALGAATARYAPAGADPTADLVVWYDAVQAGEPYRADNPAIAEAAHQLTTWKSPYYQDGLIAADVAGHDEVPVLDVQGWTDSLFPEVEANALVNKLKRADGRWPVSVTVGDVGHAIAQNKASDWQPINAAANAFLDHYVLLGSRTRLASTFSARATTCDATVGALYKAGSWTALARGRLHLAAAGGSQATTSAAGDPPGGAETDPVANGGTCIMLAPGQSSGVAMWDFPVAASVVLLGAPVVTFGLTLSGTDAEVNTRLWDVAPDGSRTLVTRGAFRLAGASGPTTVAYPLWGNGWVFRAGHAIRLEAVQNDAPYLRADNLASAITYQSVALDLPVR